MKTYNIVDLFCGCGGGAVGIERLGRTNTLFAIDFWKPAVDSYNYNLGNKAIQMDIHSLDEQKIKELIGEKQCDILIGSPPCQGFSIQNRHKYKNSDGTINNDMEQKNHLFIEFLRVANILQPKVIVMENVKGILSMKNEFGNLVFNDILQAFKEIGYNLKFKIIKCEELGLPQTRHRVILLASNNENIFNKLEFPKDMGNRTSIGKAIIDIPEFGNDYRYNLDKCFSYIKSLRNENDILIDNITNNTTNIVKERIKLIKTGMCMKDLPNDEPLKIKAKFNNSYKRESMGSLIETISNIAKNILIHPYYDRIYTIREGLRLQNFPDKYILQGSIQDKYLMIANAIPPLLTENVVRGIIDVLDDIEKGK